MSSALQILTKHRATWDFDHFIELAKEIKTNITEVSESDTGFLISGLVSG
jgi:hypothetical protein